MAPNVSAIRYALLFLMLFAGDRAQADGAALPSAWYGVIGTAADVGTTPPNADSPVSPLADGDFGKGLRGSIRIRFSPPKRGATSPGYSATMTVFDGERTIAFRSKGVANTENGAIHATWTAKGKTAVTAELRLERTDEPASRWLLLRGDVTVILDEVSASSLSCPVFLLPEVFSKTFPYDGSVQASDGEAAPSGGPGNYNFLLSVPPSDYATGCGWARIDTRGLAKLAGSFPDGSKFSASVPILNGGGHFLALAVPAKKAGFLGAWAIGDLSAPDSDWHGKAFIATAVHNAEEIDFALSAFDPKAVSLLGWNPEALGELHLQIHNDSESTDIELSERNVYIINSKFLDFDGRRSFKEVEGANPPLDFVNLKFFSLTIDPRKGVFRGLISYFNEGRKTSLLIGTLNQKTGVIQGRLLPASRKSASKPGWFDIIPR